VRFRPFAVLLVVAFVLAGCGGKKQAATTSTEASAATKAAAAAAAARTEIAGLWETFFDGHKANGRQALLEKGASFTGPLAAIQQSVLARGLSAKVSKVVLDGPNKATVYYTLLLNKQPVLKNATGTAVRVNGHWLVGDTSFCRLLALEGATPPPCPAAK
jgi:hypothetical protein